ncbi:TPA: hypothetical protein NV758_001553 [Escherichia coli]|uniref:Uncharacterized protein n=1 Tax=Escherichia phage vB_Eco_slurp01 TaxID=1874688 RepID=A0A1C3S6B9_9CAUD|nr:hypothetical protein [Escherichia coli]WIL00551.1 hypothetical protein [Escherichia phage vB_EcoM_CRJP21]SCA80174.1 hypothetical protein PSLUR01_00197 [Escherichia phage vB_Eco_slurp01]MDI1114234.1 hypothetical protein [Escherichia coli]WIL01134.1 hypothetical protein [Escherichia phage vB_EcoM_CRJP21]
MRILLTANEIEQVLTTNLEDWKREADIQAVQRLNDELTPDDLSKIVDPQFYEDIHDTALSVEDVLDKHYIDIDLQVYGRKNFITIHDIYNN